MQVTETNVSSYSIGSFAALAQDTLPVPDTAQKNGKAFFGELLQLTGMEFSLHSLPPRAGMPFLHAHTRNEELYLFISGTGQFQVDGATFPVSEGSLVRVAPDGARSWRNTGSTPLVYCCVQAPANSQINRQTSDGRLVRQKLTWPD